MGSGLFFSQASWDGFKGLSIALFIRETAHLTALTVIFNSLATAAFVEPTL